MTRKSFVFKMFLLCLLLAFLLWLLQINYFSKENASVEKFVRENQIKKSLRGNAMHIEPNATKLWLVIFWSMVFGNLQNIQLTWKNGECPVPCEITSDRSRADDAKGFIVHARDSHMTPPTESVPWILLTQENPVYTPVLADAKFMSKFGLLMSYRLDSDFPKPFYSMPRLTSPVSFKEKDGFIMAVFSNCEPVRTEYIRQLMQFVQVDSYGACLKNKNDLVAIYGSAGGRDFKSLKIELAKKYKFTLVFFNQDCDYFVDDQLSHTLDAGSVPVVMGTDKLDEFLPGNLRQSVIRVRDFKNPQHLADYLKSLNNNETEYSKYLEWKWKGLGNITGTVIGDYWRPKYPLYCQICVALSEERIHEHGLKPITCKARNFTDWGIINGTYLISNYSHYIYLFQLIALLNGISRF